MAQSVSLEVFLIAFAVIEGTVLLGFMRMVERFPSQSEVESRFELHLEKYHTTDDG